jgi:hypothetical protein
MNTQERTKLSALTGICMTTVIRWDRGTLVRSSTSIALSNASEQLGISANRQAMVVLKECTKRARKERVA